MKPPTRAPAYACIYHGLAEVARKLGYALAIHGSVLTDLDLIAVPWVPEAVPAEELVEAIKKHVDCCGVNMDDVGVEHDAVIKPHGRLAWKLVMEAGGSVDLSVLPRHSGSPGVDYLRQRCCCCEQPATQADSHRDPFCDACAEQNKQEEPDNWE